MKRLQTIAISLLLAGILTATANTGEPGIRLDELSLTELEQRLIDIDAELEQLSSYTLRSGAGAVGYRSGSHEEPSAAEWIRIELGEAITVDQIVLVPTLYRDPDTGLRSEGFPSAFRIIAGTSDTSNVVATFSAEDELLPRIAPLAVSFKPITASWIRIEATALTRYISSRKYLLQLSEILVFSGMENVALHKPVITPKPTKAPNGPRHERNLTDGATPFLMDAPQGPFSQTSLIKVNGLESTPNLLIDLKKPQLVNQLNLHAANLALSIPITRLDSWGVPRHVRATGGTRSDFSDQASLFEYQQQSIFDFGPIIMQRFPEKLCRYIRIEIVDHHPVVSWQDNRAEIAFAEIEVLSNGTNSALGSTVSISPGLVASNSALYRLTDGLNYYGQILPMREWMNQLARRHDLEKMRPLVAAELTLRYDLQKTNLRRMQWLAALLAAGTIIIILIERGRRQRAISQTRERIAANLHDELGANLHAIGLFGDLAKQEVNETDQSGRWDQLVHYVEEIRTLTTHAGKTAKYCTNMLEAKGLHTNLVVEIKRTAELLSNDLDHELSFENEELLQSLPARKRIDLALFYKECITNIIRHANATHAKTTVVASKKETCLSVSDNGQGVETSPASLKRRARLLKAKLTVEPPADGGTTITLRLRHRSRSL
ncbi:MULTISPECIES: ATP-binding protein [unclassified Lentimonas]|uniref:ATP-binding protein n=1 Tax=unclassified Lentimonas TaxID=2630993 RepID=UPI001329C475|nr:MULTISPECIES: ATP-binding protein [unclassified Lentimonas]CAA6677746.1 Unannotated [Lentimonas sp. CC4]CAA6685010.1 Unannotated [Lentimonas sp. CC6]CAA7077872.1 Unannotated [Lentimonas sp. CC4]CAA7169800.1 Unannotated [Lentimonas sp. CC21]CAA7179918.1 Unannotated [Lentimonas sp. CC8]